MAVAADTPAVEATIGRRHVPFDLIEAEWERAAGRWLPIREEKSIWRSADVSHEGLPSQGWKLHVAATLLTATQVLEAVAPLLWRHQVPFKGPATLLELKRLNCGLFYGYSQVGKFLTVYPRNDDEAMDLAGQLDQLTRGFAAPRIPFEEPVAPGSSVFVRYGAFGPATPEDSGFTIRSPSDELVPDRRDRNPDWVLPPEGLVQAAAVNRPSRGLLATTYRVYEAISQRGKGGVYRALDIGSVPPRRCIVKEGRGEGEIDWDLTDGRARIARDVEVLAALQACDVPVPEIYAAFTEGNNSYVVLEQIEGESLAALSAPDRTRLSSERALALAGAAASILAAVHHAGWVWRDLKAANFIVTPEGELRPLDFEGAVPLAAESVSPWGTAGYLPPEWTETLAPAREQDCYALGVLIHQIFTGHIPGTGEPPDARAVRDDVPGVVLDLIGELTHADPERRPVAAAVTRKLGA